VWGAPAPRRPPTTAMSLPTMAQPVPMAYA
jgi:hypothetical protein